MSVGIVRDKGPVLFRLTVKQYHQMIHAGILTEDDPVELLEGFLVEKMPHNPPHDSTLSRLYRLLAAIVPDQWALRNQCAITLANSEPEPDLVIARGPDDRYEASHPGPKDIELIVEVSDSTLHVDRDRKGQVYARAGVAVYWVVNLVEAVVEIYTNPTGGRKPHYRSVEVIDRNDRVSLTLGDRVVARIAVKDFMPKLS